MGVNLCASVLVELGASIADLALVNIRQKRRHVCVYHRGEEFLMQGGVAEALLKTVAGGVGTLRMDVCGEKFLLRWNVERECGVEYSRAVHLEENNDQDGWDGCDPVQCFEALLETDC